MTARPRALFLTQQTTGLGARKTSMIFLAEAFDRIGYDTSVVTTQLSWLTALSAPERLRNVPDHARNRWYAHGGMRGFVWVPPLHPARFGSGWANWVSAPLVGLYGRLLPATLRDAVRRADVVVIESCAAVALFPALRRLNPQAAYIYSMSDRLAVVGMHPALDTLLQREADRFDLIRVPAAAMRDDFASDNVAHIAHGLDKAPFDDAGPSPYVDPVNAVVVGEMMLDRPVLAALAAACPHVTFHCFGRSTGPSGGPHANVRLHGETPFATVAAYVRHADVGLALYSPRPGLDYLAQSSLKNLQYSYCGLPIVAPRFVAEGLPNAHAYAAGDADDAVAAMRSALQAGKVPEARRATAHVRDWDAVGRAMLDQAAHATAIRLPR